MSRILIDQASDLRLAFAQRPHVRYCNHDHDRAVSVSPRVAPERNLHEWKGEVRGSISDIRSN